MPPLLASTFRFSHNTFVMYWRRLFTPRRIYLDHAAGTPLEAGAKRILALYAGKEGNPSAIHKEGQALRTSIEHARGEVASLLGVRSGEIIFTSGGTESNNLAISGLMEALEESTHTLSECEIITTTLEHPSILAVLASWKKKGVTITYVPVSEEGLIDHAAFERLLSPRTVLVTFAYANSEIGVVQDVKRITRAVRNYRKETKSAFPYVHLDASQAPLYLPCSVTMLGVDMMTLDASKCGGPTGAGLLVKRHAVPLLSILNGGSQEEGLRPGTENTGAILASVFAYRHAQQGREAWAQKVSALRDYAIDALRAIPGVILNGSPEDRIANNINISIPGIDGEYATVVLDTHGIAISTKSACSGRTGSGSSVIYALGGDDARALSTLRITLGEKTTKKELDQMVAVLKTHVSRTREYLDQASKE